jgi:hypothetical protein
MLAAPWTRMARFWAIVLSQTVAEGYPSNICSGVFPGLELQLCCSSRLLAVLGDQHSISYIGCLTMYDMMAPFL